MAIRIRWVGGRRIAVCAAETEVKPGDVYLDDADHEALTSKFCRDHRDWLGEDMWSGRWKLMEQEEGGDG